jgi:PAS domain-containing protein
MNDRITPPWPARTYFAPAGRDTFDEFRRKVAIVEQHPLLREVLNAMPGMMLVVNSNRQIVSANDAVLQLLNIGIDDVLEKRPGEALGCIRAKYGPDGCGTDLHCLTCGAVNAILECQDQRTKVVRECRILVTCPTGFSPYDLRVTATPITLDGEQFVVAAMEDISQTKRLDVLQRVFFHDVMNTALCISSYANILTKDPATIDDAGKLLKYLSEELIE